MPTHGRCISMMHMVLSLQKSSCARECLLNASVKAQSDGRDLVYWMYVRTSQVE